VPHESILCTTFALMFMSFYYVRRHKWRVGYLLNNLSLCLFNHVSICRAKGEGSVYVSSWTQAQSACFPHSFCQYQIILPCYRGNGLLEGFYIQQRRHQELTPCQREVKFDAPPLTPPRYVTRLYVCCKNLACLSDQEQYLRCRFALPNTTQDSDHCWLRIYGWIPYRHCRMSVRCCCVLVSSIVS